MRRAFPRVLLVVQRVSASVLSSSTLHRLPPAMPPKRKAPDASSIDESPTKRVTRASAALVVTQPGVFPSQLSPTKRRGRPPGIPANVASKTPVRTFGKKRIRSTRSLAASSLKENRLDGEEGGDASEEEVHDLRPENQVISGSDGTMRKRTQRVVFDSIIVTNPRKTRTTSKQRFQEAGSSRMVALPKAAPSITNNIVTTEEIGVIPQSHAQRAGPEGVKTMTKSSSTPPNLSPKTTQSTIVLPRILPSSLYACLSSQKEACISFLQDPPFVEVDSECEINDTAYRHLLDLLVGTVERGEGNSCLVIGPSGSGKTRVFAHLSNICDRHAYGFAFRFSKRP